MIVKSASMILVQSNREKKRGRSGTAPAIGRYFAS